MNCEVLVFVYQGAYVGVEGVQHNTETGHGSGMIEVCGKNFIQSLGAIDVQVVFAVVQVHGKQQAGQAQVVVAMQVRYEDVVDAHQRQPEACQLHLSAFTAVYQHIFVVQGYELCGRKASVSRNGTTASQYGYGKIQPAKSGVSFLLLREGRAQFRA